MNLEREERIVLRYSKGEFSALLKLMTKPKLPGLSITAKEPDDGIFDSLALSGIIASGGSCIFVDKTVAFILEAALGSRRYLTAASDENQAVLYESERMCVLIENTYSSIVRVEPLKSVSAARKPWLKAVSALEGCPQFSIAEGETVLMQSGKAEQIFLRFARQTDSEV